MLTINVWKHTKGKNKGNFKGPLFSAVAGGKVGHIDLEVLFEEEQKTIKDLKKTYSHLNPKLSISYETVKIAPQNNNNLKEELVEYRRGDEKLSLSFIHSYWPEHRPTIKEELLGIIKKNGGIKPSFQSFLQDMSAEAPSIMVNGTLQDPSIYHLRTQKRIKQQIENLRAQIVKLETEICDLKIEKNSLSCIIKEQEEEITVISEELLKLENQYLIHQEQTDDGLILSNEVDSFDEVIQQLERIISDIDANMRQFLHKSIMELQEKLDDKLDTVLINKNDYLHIQEKILSNQEQVNKLQEQIEILQNELSNQAVTEGKQPDFSVSIPTESGLKFSLDKKAILEEMARQRADTVVKYSLYANNCAMAVKTCLVVGIPLPMRAAMKDLGVSDKFFQVSLESPMSVFQWVLKLNTYINELNCQNSTQLGM